MKAYKASFAKKSGDIRTMSFAKIDDIPSGVLPDLKGGRQIALKEGMELVWDLERGNYRVFNWKTVVGKIEEFETKI